MSQIYKVFFNNISFEIKPLLKLESKEDYALYVDCFDKFIFIINDELNEKLKRKQQFTDPVILLMIGSNY